MGELPTVRIEPGFGRHTVVLDGQDVSELLRRVTVDVQGSELPEVFLELRRGILPESIECQAVVHALQEVPADEVECVRRFLAGLDADDLERRALETMELGGPSTFGAAALEVLVAMVEGPGGD